MEIRAVAPTYTGYLTVTLGVLNNCTSSLFTFDMFFPSYLAYIFLDFYDWMLCNITNVMFQTKLFLFCYDNIMYECFICVYH